LWRDRPARRTGQRGVLVEDEEENDGREEGRRALYLKIMDMHHQARGGLNLASTRVTRNAILENAASNS